MHWRSTHKPRAVEAPITFHHTHLFLILRLCLECEPRREISQRIHITVALLPPHHNTNYTELRDYRTLIQLFSRQKRAVGVFRLLNQTHQDVLRPLVLWHACQKGRYAGAV